MSAELCYYNARYYDPELSRFIQPDTIADLDDPQTLNCYSYVNNNPLNSTDPTGHEVSHNDAFDAKVLSIDGGTTQKELEESNKEREAEPEPPVSRFEVAKVQGYSEPALQVGCDLLSLSLRKGVYQEYVRHPVSGIELLC